MDKQIVSLRAKALEIAISYNGTKEEPGNTGKFVTDSLKLVGLGTGHAWCQAFIYRCYHEAAIALGVPNPCTKVAGVLRHWQQTKGLKLSKLAAKDMQAGDIIVYDHGKGLGHICFFIKNNADGTMQTIEGNTSLGGSRNGDGVYILNRRKLPDAKYVGVIRY
jgi:hypothetical protein